MKVFGVIFLFVGSVTSTDVGSLMQVGVEGHAASGASVALAAIRSEIDAMVFADNGNKLAIQSLLQEVNVADPIDSTTTGLLGDINDILDEILAYLVGLKAAADTNIQAAYNNVANCRTTHAATLAASGAEFSAESAAATAKTAHEDCRKSATATDDEYDLFTDAATKCGELVHCLENHGLVPISEVKCVVPDPQSTDYTQRDVWQTFFQTGNDAFTSWNDCINLEKADCLAATKLLEDQISECHGKQNTYEQAQCTWREKVDELCTAGSTCYSTETANYNAQIPAWTEASDLNCKDAAVILHIKCLINNLLADPAITDIEACATTGADPAEATHVATYGNVILTLPGDTGCVSQSGINYTTDPYPGAVNSGWRTTTYSGLDPLTPFNNAAPTSCV